MYKFEEELNKKKDEDFTIDRILTVLFVCLHIALSVLCFIIFAKLDAAFTDLDIAAGEKISTELTVFNIVVLFAGLSNIASAIAVVYRQYKREKYEKAFLFLLTKNAKHEEAFNNIDNEIKTLNSIKCTKCGTIHPTGTKFCQNCGQSLTNKKGEDK